MKNEYRAGFKPKKRKRWVLVQYDMTFINVNNKTNRIVLLAEIPLRALVTLGFDYANAPLRMTLSAE